jgi:hypothetical protein
MQPLSVRKFRLSILGVALAIAPLFAHGPALGDDLGRHFCGIFDVEGVLKRSAKHPGFQELWVDSGTLSERRIVIGKMSASDQEMMDGVGIRARVWLMHSCFGECYGGLIRPGGLLDPTEPIRGLAADMSGARVERRACLSKIEARNRVLAGGAGGGR